MSIVARKLCGSRSGQALVEFALVVPIFLLLVIATPWKRLFVRYVRNGQSPK